MPPTSDDETGGAIIILGFAVGDDECEIDLDAAAVRQLDKYVENGIYGSTRAEFISGLLCNKLGADSKRARHGRRDRGPEKAPQETGQDSEE